MIRAALFAAFALAAAPALAQAPLTLDALETMALDSHPGLAGATAALEAASADARQAGAWPNPSIAYVADEVGGHGSANGQHGVVIDQTVPLGGKLRLSREALAAGADRSRALLDRERLVVLARVRLAYFGVLAAQARLDVRERLSSVAAEAQVVSTQLFNVGAVDRPDVLMAEMEAARADLGRSEASHALDRAWAELAAAVGQPALPRQPVKGGLDSPLPELPRDATLAAALAASPDLAAGRAAEARAEREVASARKATFPDLLLKGGPRYNREPTEPAMKPAGLEWALEAGLTVPVWNRNANGVAAATSTLGAARAARAATELELRRVFAVEFDRYETSRERADRFRQDILPRAQQAYDLYMASYSQMAASYPQVLASQRALNEAHEQFLDALEQARQAAVHLKDLLAERGQ